MKKFYILFCIVSTLVFISCNSSFDLENLENVHLSHDATLERTH